MRPVVLCLPDGVRFFDPGADETARRDVELLAAWDDRPAGIVGWSAGGWSALRLAAEHPDRVERLVVVATPYPDEEPTDLELDAVQAKTLLLYGSADPQTGSRHGRLWQTRLANSRLEVSPGGTHDLLVPRWPRVLSHLAPGSARQAGSQPSR